MCVSMCACLCWCVCVGYTGCTKHQVSRQFSLKKEINKTCCDWPMEPDLWSSLFTHMKTFWRPALQKDQVVCISSWISRAVFLKLFSKDPFPLLKIMENPKRALVCIHDGICPYLPIENWNWRIHYCAARNCLMGFQHCIIFHHRLANNCDFMELWEGLGGFDTQVLGPHLKKHCLKGRNIRGARDLSLFLISASI